MFQTMRGAKTGLGDGSIALNLDVYKAEWESHDVRLDSRLWTHRDTWNSMGKMEVSTAKI